MNQQKKRGRRPKIPPTGQPIRTIFPSFSLREAHILMQCIGYGMTEGVLVDGEFAKADEWDAIMRQLLRH